MAHDIGDVASSQVRLVDALRDYIRDNDAFACDLLDEGQITLAEIRAIEIKEMRFLRTLLKELEGDVCGPNLLDDFLYDRTHRRRSP